MRLPTRLTALGAVLAPTPTFNESNTRIGDVIMAGGSSDYFEVTEVFDWGVIVDCQLALMWEDFERNCGEEQRIELNSQIDDMKNL